jgi:transcriptional regulator with XRE-family HTH domain
MNNIIKKNKNFSFNKNLKKARKSAEYYEEDMLLDVSSRIIDVMENRNMTRSLLANKLDVSPAYITKILRGNTNMSIETLAKIALALELKWECVLIPQNSKIGIYSLFHESGTTQICKTETTTIEMEFNDTVSINTNEYEQDVMEVQYAMPIPA